MKAEYGSVTQAYHAYKSMIFAPSGKEALTGLIAYLEAHRPQSPLLVEAQKFVDADIMELEFDFNRMCIGPYKLLVMPYESVYRTGSKVMNTDDTVKVADFYQEIGLIIDETFNEPADFIGNELEFLYCVHALADEQQMVDNLEAVNELRALGEAFLTTHLGTWITPYCEGIEKHAKQAFWGEFARDMHSFITEQLQNNAA